MSFFAEEAFELSRAFIVADLKFRCKSASLQVVVYHGVCLYKGVS